MPSVNRPLPSNTQAAVSTLMQKMSKLEQAQQEYTQVLRAVSSPAQKVAYSEFTIFMLCDEPVIPF